ncbi:MAG: TIGR02266 family protein [Pseudomonadota bacterium]
MRRDDRRLAPRKMIRLEVHYSTSTDVLSNFSHNLNQGGLFIETDVPSPIGTDVEIKFFLPSDNRPIQTRGSVVWSSSEASKEPGGTGQAKLGMGIEFDNLSREDKERIDNFIKNMKH